MINISNRIFRYVPDQATVWTLVSRCVQAVGSVAIIPLIILKLSSVEQGVYYAFANLLAAQVLLELGFGTVSLQSISYSRANLGDYPFERIDNYFKWAAHIRLCLLWFSVCGLLAPVVLAPVGLIFFAHNVQGASAVSWIWPWTLLTLSTGIGIAATGLTIAAEGSGFVTEVARVRACAGVIRLLVLGALLVCGARLWAAGFAALIWAGVLVVGIRGHPLEVILDGWKHGKTSWSNWRREVFPFQWRIALSWASGFLVYQLMTLAILSSKGPIAAGRFGIGLALSTGVSAIASSWVVPKQNPWAAMVARSSWSELDDSWRRATSFAVISAFAGVCLISLFLTVAICWQPRFADRFPDSYTWAGLAIVAVVNQFVFSTAVYLRAHGKEVLLVNSIVFGLLMVIFCWLFAHISMPGYALTYAALTILIGVCWGGLVFNRCRRLWH